MAKWCHHLWENLSVSRIIKTMCTVPCVGLFWLLFPLVPLLWFLFCKKLRVVWLSLSGDNCNVKEAEIGFLFRIFWMKWRRSWQNLKRSSLMVMHTAIMHTWLHIIHKVVTLKCHYFTLYVSLLCWQQSGRSWPSPAAHREPEDPADHPHWVREPQQQLHHSSNLATVLRWSEQSCTVRGKMVFEHLEL